jgi:putative SOS response-associated peptidase YedK
VARPDTDLAREFDVAEVVGEEPEASWNVAPTQVARVVLERVPHGRDDADHAAAQRMLRSARWGLVPADGYYEWEKIDGRKVPYFLHRGHDLLAFAGLYELWPDPERAEDDPDRWLFSYTILTHPAPDAVGHIHDRSPVLVPPGELRTQWLDPVLTDLTQVRELLRAIPEPRLEPYEVSPAVNSPRNNGAELLKPVH